VINGKPNLQNVCEKLHCSDRDEYYTEDHRPPELFFQGRFCVDGKHLRKYNSYGQVQDAGQQSKHTANCKL